MSPLCAAPGTAAAAILLFLYFFQRPEPDTATYCIIFGIWAAAMAADLHITFANRTYIPGHEQSLVLSLLYERFSPRRALLLTVATESSCIVLLPAMVLLRIDAAPSAAVAYVFAALHSVAVYQNEKFVRVAAGSCIAGTAAQLFCSNATNLTCCFLQYVYERGATRHRQWTAFSQPN